MNFKTNFAISISAILSMACVKVTEKVSSPAFPEGYQEEIQVDRVIENPHQDLSKPWVIQAKRLILKPGGKLVSRGADIQIEVEELYTEGGQIETFSDSQQQTNPQVGQDGRNSGRLIVQAKKEFQGKLKLISRGEAGGSGIPGLSAQELGLGIPAPAEAGNPGVVGVDIGFSRGLNFEALPRELPERPSRPIPFCETAARDGGHGQKGFPGGAGGPGMRGGDSGEIRLYVPANVQPDIEIIRIPGAPGLGGQGGLGGPGGEGGNGGAPGVFAGRTICPAGNKGPQGPVGDTGASGAIGQAGQVVLACVFKGDQAYCLDQLPF
jgi:hypothetical protein